MEVPRPGKLLFVSPEPVEFDSEQAKELKERLKLTERNTRIDHVRSIKELTFDSGGLLPDGYRVSKTALRQICGVLSNGLWRFLLDVSGIHRKPDSPRTEYSFNSAIRQFNEMVALRGPTRAVGRLQLVRDTHNRIVEGVLGPQALYMDNFDLMDRAVDTVRSSPKKTEFYSATLVGRRMVLRFRTRDPVAELKVGKKSESFYSGFHFSNSSVAGESVRAGIVLYRDGDGTSSCGGYSSAGKIRHTGKDFRSKVRRMLNGLLKRVDVMDAMGGMLERLQAQSMGFTRDRSEFNERVEYFVRGLYRTGVLSKGDASRIVQTALQSGNRRQEPVAVELMSLADADSRTLFDLYSAMTRVAQELPIQLQEATEQLAYRLLTGRLKFEGTLSHGDKSSTKTTPRKGRR